MGGDGTDLSIQMFKALEKEHCALNTSQLESYHVSIWISFFEIYNENIYDLLELPSTMPKKKTILKIGRDRNQNVYIKELTYVNVYSCEEAYKVLMYGKKNLSIASTNLNNRSSRSHCVFSIKMVVVNPKTEELVRMSTFDICDLAGTERQKKTQTSGERLKEARTINSSLHVLTRCFNILRENSDLKPEKKKIVPYRDSKLTQIFQRSLNGNRSDVTVKMIVNVNSSPLYAEETLQVLKISAIARNIMTVIKPKKPVVERKKTRFSVIASQYQNENVNWQDTDILFGRASNEDFMEFNEEREELYEKIERLELELAEYKQFDKKAFESQITDEIVSQFDEELKKMSDEHRDDINKMRSQWKEEKEEINKFYMRQIQELKKLIKSSNTQNDLDDSMDQTLREDLDSSINNIETIYKSKIDDLSNENDKLKDEIKELNSKLKLANEQAQKVDPTINKQRIIQKDKEIQGLRELLNQAKEEFKIQENEAVEMRTDIDEYKQQIKELTIQVTELQEDLEQREFIISNKADENDELQDKIEFLENKLQEELVNHERIINEMEKENEKLKQNSLTSVESKTQVLEFERKLSEKNVEISKLKHENLEKSQQIDQLIEQSKISFKNESQISGEQSLEKEIKNLSHLLVKKDEEILDLKNKLCKFEKIYATWKSEKLHRKNEAEELKRKICELTIQIERLDKEVERYQTTIKNMESDEQSVKANHAKVLQLYEDRLNKCLEELQEERNKKIELKETITSVEPTEEGVQQQNTEKENQDQQVLIRNLQHKLLLKDETINRLKSQTDSRPPLASLQNQAKNKNSLADSSSESDNDPDYMPRVRAKSTSKKCRVKDPELIKIQSNFKTPNRGVRTKLFDASLSDASQHDPNTTPKMKDVSIEKHVPSPKSQVKKKLRPRRKNKEN